MQISELERWLQDFPLDEPVDIDDEFVYLRVEQGGAELGVHFLEGVTDHQLQEALQCGFQNAMEFDAGWSISIDSRTLLLSQWLPNVSSWTEVAEPLEKLLNQVEALRTMEVITIAETENTPSDISSRDERHIRNKLIGER